MKVPYSGGLPEVLNSFETFASKSCATTLKLSTSDLNRFDTCETHPIHVKVLVGQGNCFFPVNKEEEEDKNKQEEDEIKTTMQCSAAMQQIVLYVTETFNRIKFWSYVKLNNSTIIAMSLCDTDLYSWTKTIVSFQ